MSIVTGTPVAGRAARIGPHPPAARQRLRRLRPLRHHRCTGLRATPTSRTRGVGSLAGATDEIDYLVALEECIRAHVALC
jgi:hypothetical protein